MAERAINQKRAQFLSNFAPVSVTLDDIIRDKLECGKFPLTKTGWLKIAAMIVSLAGLALFLAQTWDVCTDKPQWHDTAFTACVGANFCVQALFYLIFSFGGTVNYPGKWVSADIVLNLVFGVVGIVGSVMTTTSTLVCKENATMHKIPGPLGIAGGVMTIIGCAAIFLMYRYVDNEDEDEPPERPTQRYVDPRKSMHA